MTFSREDPRAKLTIRLNEELKSDIQELAEKEGKSMSEVIREEISDIGGETSKIKSENGTIPPVQKDLRLAWQMLDSLTGDRGELELENATTMLSQEFGKSKKVVLQSLIKPLEKRGYLQVYPRINSVIIHLQVRP